VVVCLEKGADLHTAQLMPLPLTASCFSKIQMVLPLWYRFTRVVPDKGQLNGCIYVCMNFGNKSCTYPEQHELVEWVVPLHQENVGWRCSTHVHVIITRTGYNTATIAALCVGHLSRYGKSPKISHTHTSH